MRRRQLKRSAAESRSNTNPSRDQGDVVVRARLVGKTDQDGKLFGRAGRSWNSVRVVRPTQVVNAMALLLSPSLYLARGVEDKQRCSRDGTGLAAPRGSAQDEVAVNLGQQSLSGSGQE